MKGQLENPGDYYKRKQALADEILKAIEDARSLRNSLDGMIKDLEAQLERARYVGD